MFIISNVIGGNTLFNSTQEFLTDVLALFCCFAISISKISVPI